MPSGQCVAAWADMMFAALANRNYRLVLSGHAASTFGTWVQRVGQALLVLQLTGSSTLLGVTVAMQGLPYLVIGLWGGVLADRMNKRRVLIANQIIQCLVASLLAILTAAGVITVGMVMTLVLVAGVFQAIEQPVRNSFLYEVVGPDLMTNALALYHVTFNVSRAAGPSLAAVIVGNLGIAWTFGFNALSYIAVTFLLLAVRTDLLDTATPLRRARGQVREALNYVMRSRDLFLPFLLAAAVGMVGWGWDVMTPLLAIETFGGNEDTMALMFGALGVGSIVCGLVIASHGRASLLLLGALVALLGVARLAVGASPNLLLLLLPLFVAGGLGTAVRTIAQSIMQVRAHQAIRGRTMAVLGLGLTGMTPIGAVLMGWISEVANPRLAMFVSGVILLAACVLTASISRVPQPLEPTGRTLAGKDVASTQRWGSEVHGNRPRQSVRAGKATPMGSSGADGDFRTAGPHYGRVPWFEPDELTEEQLAYYDALTTGPRVTGPRANSSVDERGRLRGGFNAQLLSPRVGHAVQAVGAVLRHESSLTVREQEIAIMEIALAERSTRLWHGHARRARTAGLSEAGVEAIRNGEDTSELTDRERLVRLIVRSLAAHGDLDDDLFEQARDDLGLDRLFDVVAIYGHYRHTVLSHRVWRVP